MLLFAGLEGTAAAQASDFAFTKFHFLRRALLVHGHWFVVAIVVIVIVVIILVIIIACTRYYVRVSFLIQYSLYKNIACFTGQVLPSSLTQK